MLSLRSAPSPTATIRRSWRLRRGLHLNRYDCSTFYGGDGRDYIDYPAHPDLAAFA